MLTMPRRIYQHDLDKVDYRDHYVIRWSRPNSEVGTFRCNPLKDNIGQGKREIMSVIRVAYDIKLRSFQECIDLCEKLGVQILHYKKGEWNEVGE